MNCTFFGIICHETMFLKIHSFIARVSLADKTLIIKQRRTLDLISKCARIIALHEGHTNTTTLVYIFRYIKYTST